MQVAPLVAGQQEVHYQYNLFYRSKQQLNIPMNMELPEDSAEKHSPALSEEEKEEQPPTEKNKKGQLESFGVRSDLYRLYPDGTRVSSFIKTGTDFALLPRNPEFLQRDDPYEPLYVPKPDVLETALKREIEKFCFADTLLNKVVYDCSDPSPFVKEGQQAELGLEAMPYYVPSGPSDTTLVFESRFESGNLRRAIQISEFEYNLILKPDYFTTGNTQWYYFSVGNTQNYQEYRFNIINMMKPDSLYNQGMKPMVYSMELADKKQVGWYRDGYDICYYQNNMKRKSGGYYYSLVFSVKFPFKGDTVYLTHSYPYTYSQLLKYLGSLEADDYKSTKMKRKTLCQTVAGNNCDYLVITDYDDNGKKLHKEGKKSIMITSRVHPGETMASFIVEYIIDFLTGPSQEAQQLRRQFIFKVIPMLNIDGVLNGNYRVSLCGLDLNRQWLYPNKSQHPTVFYTKQMVKKLTEQKGLMFFCDIHGHSRKKNIFMYGCSGKDPNKRELAFPILMKNNCQVFCYKDCCFAVQKDREGSARIALWKDFNLVNCFTLEVSFCGADFGKYEFFHYNQDIYQEIAENFCQSLVECYEPDQLKVKAALEEAKQIANGIDSTANNKMADNSDGDSDYDNVNEEDKTQNPKQDNPQPPPQDKKLEKKVPQKNISQKKKK